MELHLCLVEVFIYLFSLFFSRSLPFRGPDKNADPAPSFTPVSSWVNLDRESLKSCLDPSQLKKSPTNANFNEQTRRFQNTCQLAVNVIVHSKTSFLPEGFLVLSPPHVDLQVHGALRPGVVRVGGAAVEKEFAQFVFSLLLEILDACSVGNVVAVYVELLYCPVFMFLSLVALRLKDTYNSKAVL